MRLHSPRVDQTPERSAQQVGSDRFLSRIRYNGRRKPLDEAPEAHDNLGIAAVLDARGLLVLHSKAAHPFDEVGISVNITHEAKEFVRLMTDDQCFKVPRHA